MTFADKMPGKSQNDIWSWLIMQEEEMSLIGRWKLRRIGKAVGRADPRLASMFAIFSRLAVSDPMPAHEQLHVLGSHTQVILMQRQLRESI